MKKIVINYEEGTLDLYENEKLILGKANIKNNFILRLPNFLTPHTKDSISEVAEFDSKYYESENYFPIFADPPILIYYNKKMKCIALYNSQNREQKSFSLSEETCNIFNSLIQKEIESILNL